MTQQTAAQISKPESPSLLPGDSLVPLEAVLCTEELTRRPPRAPDYETEGRALGALVQALADSPRTILQKMAEIMLETLRADSSGFSLLSKEDGGKTFHWPAIAGVWKPHIGGGTPRAFGPCGDVLDRNCPLLFRHFERRYTYFLPVTPPVEECLLVPFHVEGKAVGTIWAIAHDDRRKFDAEDLRQLVSLGRFAASAYQTVTLHEEMLAMNEALLLGALRQHELTEAAEKLNAQLSEAMAVAETANQAKSDFLSSMSHELRTPLSAILGFAQLMESGSPPPTLAQKRSIDEILKAGWYLLDLINEILDLALIESGKPSLSEESVSLAEVVRECRALIEPQAQQRDIRMTYPRFDIPCLVSGDRTRVKQILINLLSNAVKYNKTGGEVVVECIATPPERVRIRVEDTGKGLTADELAQLFQPFNRLGREGSAAEGTGIGLVVCKRLVELMGGAIGVESTPGKGSVFWIDLHLTAETRPAAAARPQAPAGAQVQAKAQLRTLLYVEDNPANLRLVEDLIARRPDLRLLSAMDGTRGVEMARASKPDVILMDINLPGISGVQALRILAEDPVTAHIPVVALSAHAMPHDIKHGLGAGFFRYLTKPIRVVELMDTLDLALEFAKAQSAQSARPNDEEKA